jgi:tripartite-type tricarboxylate transporter receptor subunit TctC
MKLTARNAAAKAAIVASTALIVGLGAGPAAAADIPCGTARLVVNFGAGGHSDISARIFANAWNEAGLSPTMQVVNITGQAGNRGAREALESDADGCTLFMGHQSVLSAYLTGRTDFTWSDYTPVALLTTTPPIMGAHPDAPFDNLAELQEYAQANPGEVLTGVSLGSSSHFTLAEMGTELDIELRYISYDGTPERMQALLGNVIQLGELTEGVAQQYISAGELKGLAIFGHQRSERLPEVPTAVEQGFNLTTGNSIGWLMPGGVSQEIVDHYVAGLTQLVEDPAVVEQVEARGSVIDFKPDAEYRDWWQGAYEQWREIAIAADIYRRDD